MISENAKKYQKKWKKENRDRINYCARERYRKSDKIYEQQKKWHESHKDEINEKARKRYTSDGRWRKQLRTRFGLTPEEYWSKYEEQKGLCAICSNGQCVGLKLDVDHNHVTGKVRALLCRHCNTGIGLLKDSISRVEAALAYLRKHELP
jgi:hypothetical protein